MAKKKKKLESKYTMNKFDFQITIMKLENGIESRITAVRAIGNVFAFIQAKLFFAPSFSTSFTVQCDWPTHIHPTYL